METDALSAEEGESTTLFNDLTRGYDSELSKGHSVPISLSSPGSDDQIKVR